MAGEDSQLKVGVGTTYDDSGLKAAQKAFSAFDSNIGTLQKQLKNLESLRPFQNSVESVQRADKAISAIKGKIEVLNNAINKVPFNGIKKGSDQAANALTNLGRVAQDAPFGFIGIQNNLNPLLESFQRLRAETGSNKAALSALTTSLLGPAGLGIALSVVSSAILLYQSYQQKAARADEEKEKAQRKAIDANEAYFKSLSTIDQISVKGVQNAQKELISLEQLYFAARNVKLSMEERYKAAAALQDQYPNTFNNFTKEEIALGKASQAYKGLADDILAVARAAAATDIIIENTKKLTLEQLKYNKAQKELEKINQRIASQPKPETRAFGAGTGASSAATTATRELADLTSQQFKKQQELNASQKVKTSLVKENLDIQKLVNKEVEKEGVLALIGIDRTQEKVKKVKEKLARDSRTIGNTNVVSPNIAPTVTPIALPDLNLRGVTTGLSEYIKLMQEAYRSNERFSESVKELATSTLESGLSQAFGAIGQSLAEGTNAIDAFGSALLSAFAGFLSQLGQMFIKEGIAQIGYGIAKNLILPGSGANNIAGGLGMIGAGAAISIIGGAAGASRGGKGNYQSVKQVRGFASGVQGFGGGMAVVGERGPELLQLPQGSNVIPNPQTRQFMSEQNGVIINGNFDIGLEKLYLRLEQTGKRLNRRT